MGVPDRGIFRLGQLIQGESTLYATDLGFASGSDEFIGTETELGSEIMRKPVTWGAAGLFSKYTVELSSTDAIGSSINSVGLFDTSTIETGNIWTYDKSFIGSKNDTFNAQIEGEIVIIRPE